MKVFAVTEADRELLVELARKEGGADQQLRDAREALYQEKQRVVRDAARENLITCDYEFSIDYRFVVIKGGRS